jgi:Putative mono-oxygenase ydhR
MPQKMLVTKYNFSVSLEEYKAMTSQLAPAFADVPGCIWKIWLFDEAKKEGGAIYLFKDEDSLQNFTSSPLVAAVLSHPALTNFDLRVTDILEEVSAITRAPLMDLAVV